jgi:hypothetical protein
VLVLDFAQRVAAYFGGTEYGQSGMIPTDTVLTLGQQETIARAVVYGRLAALAMNNGDTTLAAYYRQCWDHSVKVWQPRHGLTYGQWDLCYQVGYEAARQN